MSVVAGGRLLGMVGREQILHYAAFALSWECRCVATQKMTRKVVAEGCGDVIESFYH